MLCCALCLVAKSCLTLCDSMDCSLPGSSVHGYSPGKNTWVDCLALLKGSSHPRDWTKDSCMAGGFFTIWAIELLKVSLKRIKLFQVTPWPDLQEAGFWWGGLTRTLHYEKLCRTYFDCWWEILAISGHENSHISAHHLPINCIFWKNSAFKDEW